MYRGAVPLQPAAISLRGGIPADEVVNGLKRFLGQVEIQGGHIGTHMPGVPGADHHGSHAGLAENVLGGHVGDPHPVPVGNLLEQRQQLLHPLPAQGVVNDLHVFYLGAGLRFAQPSEPHALPQTLPASTSPAR